MYEVFVLQLQIIAHPLHTVLTMHLMQKFMRVQWVGGVAIVKKRLMLVKKIDLIV